MKNLLISVLIFVLPLFSLSQVSDSPGMAGAAVPRQIKVDSLMQKSKEAHASAVATLIAGSALSIAGLIILGVQTADDDWFDDEEPNYTAGSIMFFAGGGIALLSIPQFRKSRALKKEAELFVFGKPNVNLAPGINLPRTASVGIGISIPIGK